jgi:linoleoyl-CoA desaturase
VATGLNCSSIDQLGLPDATGGAVDGLPHRAFTGVAKPEVKAFRIQLRQRVGAYILDHGGSAKGNATMWMKLAFAIFFYGVTLAALLTFNGPTWAFLSLYGLFGLAQAYMLLNVGHDASHDAITNSRFANRLLRSSLDLCGINSRLFAKSHVELHHHCVNVGRADEALRTRGFLRLSPHMPRPRWGGVQHILVWPVYALGSLDFMFVRDWEMLALDPKALPHLLVSKAAYLGVSLLLPIWATDYTALTILSGWLIAHLVTGFVVMLTLQITHIVSPSHFPAQLRGSATDPLHIMATTTDVATTSKFLAMTTGGLHQHVAHHLFPGMCHVHYQAVTGIIQRTATECHLPYRSHRRVAEALASHVALLRSLGSPHSDGDQPHPPAASDGLLDEFGMIVAAASPVQTSGR